MDRRRRGQADRIRDLAHRRRVAPLGHRARDELDDALPPFGVMPGHIGQPSRTPVLLSIPLLSSAPTKSASDRRPIPIVMRPGRWRYLRTARVMLQFPTYARLVWGLARDVRTPVGPEDPARRGDHLRRDPGRPHPGRGAHPRPRRRPHRPAAGPGRLHQQRAGCGPRGAPRPSRRPGRPALDEDLAQLRSCSGTGSTGSATRCRSCSSGSVRWGTRTR